MVQWEYKIGQRPPMSEDLWLNAMGAEGWQLCAVVSGEGIHRNTDYYFKRPVERPSPSERIFQDVKREVEGSKY